MKKFIVSNQQLKTALHKLGNVINARTILPALSNIYCKVGDKSIEMIVSDLETTMIYRAEAETSGEAFEFLLPFQLISKIVSLSRFAPLSFQMEKNKLKITGENDVYELKSLEKVESFPKLPEVPKKNVLEISSDIIKWLSVATQTLSKDESRMVLTKVLLELRAETSNIASADGSFYVFSYNVPLKSPKDDDLLISPKVIKAIDDMDKAKLFWHEKTIVFESENITVLVTRPEGKFPNFRAIIPQDFDSNITINRGDLITALEKCNINTDSFKQMKMDLTNKGKIVFTANDSQYGININVEVPGNYSGTVENINASSEKMLKLMNQVEFENIELAIHDSKRPILFRSEDSAYLGLLMSMYSKD